MEKLIKRRQPRSEETKKLLRDKLKAFYVEHPEVRKRISDLNKATGKKPPSRIGTHITDAHKAIISIANTGENNRSWKGGYENKLHHNAMRRARLKEAEGSFTHKEWIELKNRFGCKCAICLKPETIVRLTIDHVVPLSKGGSNFISNIQPLCGSCNSRKYNFV